MGPASQTCSGAAAIWSAPPKISHDEIRDAVRRSGYLLEYRIEQVLGRYGYMVEPNQAYPDPPLLPKESPGRARGFQEFWRA